MSKKTFLAAAIALILLSAGTLAAETVYLPLAMDQTIQGKTYRTILWATNVDSAPVTVTVRFIPTMTSGLVDPDTEVVPDVTKVVPPGASVPLATGAKGVGMAEINSDGRVRLVAELNSFSASGQRMSSATVELIDTHNLLVGDQTAHLLALERQVAGSQTNLGIVNLSGDDTECTIRAYRPDASQIQGTARVLVRALAHREFPDAFGILQEPSIDGARFAVSCPVPFYSYATVLSHIPDSTQFVSPAAGGLNALAGPPSDNTIFEAPGNFFNPTTSQGILEIELPVEPGVRYDVLAIEFDLFVARLPTNLFTATVQLRRPVPGGLYFAHTIRGGGRNQTFLDMGVGSALEHIGERNVWVENAQHHVVVVYDTVQGVINWQVFRGNRLVEQIIGGIGRFDLSHNGEGIRLILGLQKVFDNAFFPPYNFRYSNLRVSGQVALE